MSDPRDTQSIPRPEWAGAYDGVRILVLGASGFIGRWVARLLSQAGADLLLGIRDDHHATEIFQQFDVNGRLVQLDLNDMGATADRIGKLQPTMTFNLAGYGVSPTERDETIADRINHRLLATLCECIAEARDPNWPGQHLVHVGSALEYGTISGDLSEDSTPNPTTIYGRSKLDGTRVVTRCSRSLGIRGVTARLFTIYGPGEKDPGRLLPSLLRIAECDESLSLTAGTQTRDFTYVQDVAEGLLRLGTASIRPGNEVVNLATGNLHTVRTFAESAAAIARISDSRLQFGTTPVRPEEMSHDNVAVALLDRLLDWRPRTTIPEGIRLTMEFLQSHRLATKR